MKKSIVRALAGCLMASQACAQPGPVPWADLLTGASSVGAIGTTFDARQANVMCDGSTDDEAPLNALLAKAGEAARGKPGRSLIYLPPAARPCLLSRPLTVPGNVILFAQPGTVTLKPITSSTASVLILALNAAQNVLIYGIGFDGGARDSIPVASSARLALVYASQNVIFDHVAFRHSRGIGLEWSNASDSGVRNSEFVDIGNYWQQSGRREDRLAALNWDCGNVRNKSIFANGNTITNAGLDAISICNTDGVTVEGNRVFVDTLQYAHIRSPDYPAGIYVVRSSNVVIARNLIQGAARGCIDVAQVANVTIAGNRGEQCGASGDASIVCNAFLNNGRTTVSGLHATVQLGGITLFGPSAHIQIRSNDLRDDQARPSQQWGIQAVPGSGSIQELEIEDNELSGNARGATTQDLQAAIVRDASPSASCPSLPR
jgi:Right handed beta helix region